MSEPLGIASRAARRAAASVSELAGTVVQGWAERGERSWMMAAVSDLPEPEGPVMMAGSWEAQARAMAAKARWRAGAPPTKNGEAGRGDGELAGESGREDSMSEATEAWNWRRSSGLTM